MTNSQQVSVSATYELKENRKLNRVLVVASTIAAVTAVIHVIGGGASVWQPLAESTLADEPRLVLLAVWHMSSVALVMSAIALGLGAVARFAPQSKYLVVFVSLMWLGFVLCFAWTALTEPVDNVFTTLPQPALLLPVGVLGLVGSRRMS